MGAHRAFPGRIFFDHIPKTAGQAVSAWLVEQLGSGSVSPNLDGNHGDLIRQHGGAFAVLAAHTRFHDGEGLDPRYRYVTMLRDPVERALSWLFYVVNNHTPGQLGAVHGWARQFLDSQGAQLADGLLPYISNFQAEHFCSIVGSGLGSGQDKLDSAMEALRRFDVVGLYPGLVRFGAGVAGLIGLPAPAAMEAVNVTVARPPPGMMPAALLERIAALNRLDLPLYRQAASVFGAPGALPAAPPPAVSNSASSNHWDAYQAPAGRTVATPDLAVEAVVLRDAGDLACGHAVRVDVDFCLRRAVGELVAGIHLHDADARLAFGTNNALLGQAWRALAPGRYRVGYRITAALRAGSYSAGVAFVERLREGERELAWQDVSCRFTLCGQGGAGSAGYAVLPAAIALRRIGSAPADPAQAGPGAAGVRDEGDEGDEGDGRAQRAPRGRHDRRAGHGGAIVWCTGLSGAGKSTLAGAVARRLDALGMRACVLDGDRLRHGLCADLGFSDRDRAENVRRAGEVAKLFVDAGTIVLAAFISPFRADRERLRESVPGGAFVEVYCRCPLEVCERRDPKGLYRKARAGRVLRFTGITSPYEAPLDPDLALDTGELCLDECVERVVALLDRRGLLGRAH